jgi:ATP-dependent helicase HrpA
LLPDDFLRTLPYAQLAHVPRYLKAMLLRAERARKNPAKDTERAAQIAPYEKALATLASRTGRPAVNATGAPVSTRKVDAFRWLIEEFRVSLFAQELGTAEPVSAVKLDRVLADLQGGAIGRQEPAPATAPKPIVSAPVGEKKKIAPLKNLNALDKLFTR